MTLLKWLDHIDKMLFVLISHDTDHSILDKVMPILRDPITWIPFYVFMLIYALRRPGSQAWTFIVLSLVTVAVTDSLTAQVLKPLFGRLRPCYDPELSSSNHAANHFGLAAFWYFSIKKMSGKKWKGLWLWAAIICYAQIYVGKHFPFDILVGSLTGFLTGLGMSRLFEFWVSRRRDRSAAFTGIHYIFTRDDRIT